MASIVPRPNGDRWIQFTAPNKKRYTIRLGKVSKSQAESFKNRVESLIASKLLGQVPDAVTIAWLTEIDRNYYDRLATAGLVEGRDVRTVGDLIPWFMAELRKGKPKPSTVRNIEVVGANLIAYFKADRPIGTIAVDEANGFREWLKDNGGKKGRALARTTVSRRCRRARQIFAAAAKPHRRWIAVNPFSEMRHWCEVNQMRNLYIERRDIICVLEELTDDRVRLAVALARYAGLRAPSEPLDLRWSDIDWAHNTMNVHCVKTEHLEGKEWRIVPIMPELLPYLESLYQQAPEGGPDMIFSDYQGAPWSAFSRRIEAACRRLGIAMWMKPFINMRASCEYDWLQKHPINVVAGWLGHSPQVALLHYNRFSKELTAREASKSLPAAAPNNREVKGEVPQ